MLADLVDHVIGIDPAKNVFTAAIVDSTTAGELANREFKTTPSGYRSAIEWANEHDTDPASRAWAIEGTGSYGSGLTQILGRDGEWVIEFGHPKKQAARDGAKDDRLDALRAARETLGAARLAQPRQRGPREAMRCLLVTRESAVNSRTRAINGLKNMVISAPVELRENLTGLSTAQLVNRCARFRIQPETNIETIETKRALRSLAQRAKTLTTEANQLEKQMRPLVEQTAPQLLTEFGIGTICATQILVAWSHQGRFPTADAFCRFAGVAPITASSGGQDIIHHRLSFGGDRNLNNALHTIAKTRIERDPTTKQFTAKKRAEGKSKRDARRILKRYIARRIYRLLENPPPTN